MVDSKMRRVPAKAAGSVPTLYSRQFSTPKASVSTSNAIPPKQLPQP